MTNTMFSVPFFQKKMTTYKSVLADITPTLEEYWAQADALLPPWVSTGISYTSFPLTPEMTDQGRRLHLHPLMQPVVAEIDQMLAEFCQTLGIKSGRRAYVDHMWAQNYIEGTGVNHDHSTAVIAGTAYFKVRGVQKIIFEHPHVKLYDPPALTEAFTDTTLNYEILPEEGDVLLWPAWANHRLEMNKPADWDGTTTRLTMPFMCLIS